MHWEIFFRFDVDLMKYSLKLLCKLKVILRDVGDLMDSCLTLSSAKSNSNGHSK